MSSAPVMPNATVYATRREIFGWAMFDFANQAYTLLIITVVFGELFTTVIVGERNDGYRLANFLWSLALAISYLMVVISAPLCGAVMDYRAEKKRFLLFSYLATVATTAMLYFVEPGYVVLGLLLIVLSNYAYSMGESFIAAFLPELGPPDALGKISGFGWALGYIGGLVAAGFTLIVLGEATADNFERIRWVGPFAAGFFLVAAIPTFLWLKERGVPKPHGVSYRQIAQQRIVGTFKELRTFKDLSIFLVSLLFSMAGVYIIIAFAFIYGAQVIGWDESVRNIMFIIVQVTAAAGAIGFGFLQDKLGAKHTYQMTLALWVAAIVAIWATPEVTAWLNRQLGWQWQAQHVFLIVGCLAGLSLGSSQSASRALVGVFSPLEKSAEFFGFWGLANKLAGVLGIVMLGILQTLIGLQASILLCVGLFMAAMLICLGVNERRGRQAAVAWKSV
ncbi:MULTISPECIES: MFS transporter [Halomonadaceae]|nr:MULTISPECIES: MFS transporter [Halomonas]MCG7577811.1 MFS transporter [Halomonas sp. MMH1-48]MCG7604877.1 MFS transporter [Halomonas sp. MM17-34]MCG7614157.1 MFS transporter [Halomonas sp. MM17-29]MCG7620996.1 MFS transporter [Halomonas sp. DSH1-27]BCB59801.1 MFS transporter [Halomonas sp. A020]